MVYLKKLTLRDEICKTNIFNNEKMRNRELPVCKTKKNKENGSSRICCQKQNFGKELFCISDIMNMTSPTGHNVFQFLLYKFERN